jgi:GcrA cell cycle regulator
VKNFEWTDEAVAFLRDMLDAKRTFREIAGELGCTRNAAIGKANRLGLSGTSIKPGPHWAGKTLPISLPKPKRVRARPQPSTPAAVIAFPIKRAEPPAPFSEGEGVELMALERKHCRWPLGAKMQVSTRFCGHDKRAGSSYCDHHHRLSYTPIRRNVVDLPSVKREQRKSGLSLRSAVGRI